MTDHNISSVIAREDNGNIQITFTVPYKIIQNEQEATVAEMAKDIEIPGFRKGTAPLSRVREKIPQAKLIEHSLGHILPKALAETVKENNLKIAIYPKFELISAKEGEPWQIRGVTCELPEFDLGDYKKEIAGALRAKDIVVPGDNNKKQASREELESVVLKTLLDKIKVNVPNILVEEEADGRLSALLSRLEKLGLALESYLSSINKKPEDLRAEYASQARDAIAIDLILNKVAESEKLTVDSKEVDEALRLSQASAPSNESEESLKERRRLLESILKRRRALDFLLSLK